MVAAMSFKVVASKSQAPLFPASKVDIIPIISEWEKSGAPFTLVNCKLYTNPHASETSWWKSAVPIVLAAPDK